MITEMARASSVRYEGRTGHYRNSMLSHLVGRAGELAAERWFTHLRFPVKAHWRHSGDESLCDLTVSRHRIEVKTWQRRFWATYGRCVAVAQVPRIAEKCGAILWATADTDVRDVSDWADGVTVTLHGFSTVADVRAAPVVETGPAGRTVKNHQVRRVRQLGRLCDAIGRTVVCEVCGERGCVRLHAERMRW